MNPLNIPATEDTPEIIFDPENNVYKVSNISLPENAIEFYRPVIYWLRRYKSSIAQNSVFDFNIEYMNTASSKQIFELVFEIDTIGKECNNNIKIRWHYDKLDEDMHLLGLRFTNLVSIGFELVEYEKEDDDIDFD